MCPPPTAPQMLISGGQQGLDIEDMRAHVQYSGGYHEVGGWLAGWLVGWLG